MHLELSNHAKYHVPQYHTLKIQKIYFSRHHKIYFIKKTLRLSFNEKPDGTNISYIIYS